MRHQSVKLLRVASRSLSTTSTPLKFLVVNGYAAAGREDLTSGGASWPCVLYQNIIKSQCPVQHETHVVYSADPDFSHPDLTQYDGVCWTGSSLTAYSGTDEVNNQVAFCDEIFEAGVPQFGSCWALQMAVLAGGGTVAKNVRGREFGIGRKVTLTDEGRAHPMFEGKKQTFDVFESHLDEATVLTPIMKNLGGNAMTHCQALSMKHKNGEFWSVQYHPEYDLKEIAGLLRCRITVLVKDGFFADRAAAEAMIADFETLHKNPNDKAVAFRLGIDSDVLDENYKLLELKNWITKQVMPYQSKRLAAK